MLKSQSSLRNSPSLKSVDHSDSSPIKIGTGTIEDDGEKENTRELEDQVRELMNKEEKNRAKEDNGSAERIHEEDDE